MLYRGLVYVGDSYERNAVKGLGCTHEMGVGLDAPAAVLIVDEHKVKAGLGGDLHHLGAGGIYKHSDGFFLFSHELLHASAHIILSLH